MAYIEKKIHAEKSMMISRYYTYKAKPAKAERRGERMALTSAQQAAINKRNAINRLMMLIENNFTAGDLYITLTIDKESYSPDVKENEKLFDKFYRALRQIAAAGGQKAVYIGKTEGCYSKTRQHHHALIKSWCAAADMMKIIRRVWRYGFASVKIFGGAIADSQRIAKYWYKEEKSKRLRTSRTINRPTEQKNKVTRSECFSTKIKVPKGYHIALSNFTEGEAAPTTKEGFPCMWYVLERNISHAGKNKKAEAKAGQGRRK